jgi:hypothetical protein
MRWLSLFVLLSGCSFLVSGVHGDAVDPPASPPSSDQDLGPPAAVPDAGPVGAAIDAGLYEYITIGNACGHDGLDCASDEVCEQKDIFGGTIPGGYCSRDCTQSACPQGSQCSVPWGTVRVCLQSCPKNGCRSGYVCCKNGFAAPGVCVAPSVCPP